MNVLIVGPAGSGRWHAARSIFHASRVLPTDRLVLLPCDDVGHELLGSLFETLSRPATAPSTQSATLVLTDVDRLALELQAELAARLLNSAAAPRVLGTASAPLAALVAKQQFRADLASWLGTLVIELPALAERARRLALGGASDCRIDQCRGDQAAWRNDPRSARSTRGLSLAWQYRRTGPGDSRGPRQGGRSPHCRP